MIRALRMLVGMFAAVIVALPALAGSPALWRIADEDSEIWLFGTIHLLPQELEWRSPAFEAAFAVADTVYLETDLRPETANGLDTLIRQLGHNANFVTLSSILGSADSERLAQAAARVGVPPAALEPMRPWLASMQLMLTHIAKQGYDPRSGVDSIITARAAAAGKRLRYFESIKHQFEIFASLSPAAEKAFLISTIDQIEHKPATLDTLVLSWASGDTDTFERVFRETLGGNLPEIDDVLFTQRNRAWTAHIADAMNGSGKAIVAVGAGHLPGKQGIIALLRERGFTVTRQ